MNKQPSMKWYFFFTNIRPWIEIAFTFVMLISTMIHYLDPLLEAGNKRALVIILITMVYSFLYISLQFLVFIYEKIDRLNLLKQIENLLIFEIYTFGYRIAYSCGWVQEQVFIAMALFIPMSLFWRIPNAAYFEKRLKTTMEAVSAVAKPAVSISTYQKTPTISCNTYNRPTNHTADKTAMNQPFSPPTEIATVFNSPTMLQESFFPFDISDEYIGPNYISGKSKYHTLKGDWVRSKNEVIIANMLYQSGVKYEYERLLQLDTNEFYRPDFTIILPNGQKIFWEHCGMMDRADYRRNWAAKKRAYAKHNIIEGKNLIVTTNINSPEIKRMVDILVSLTKNTECC